MKLLIPTVYGDVHAIAVDIALTKKGHSVTRWFPELIATNSAISFSISLGAIKSHLVPRTDMKPKVGSETFNVLWNRRVGIPATKHLSLHPADKDLAKSDLYRTITSYMRHLSSTTLSVNSFDSAIRAEDKMHQLSIASRVGIRIPETLLSNDPQAIHDFLEQSSPPHICKPLNNAYWQQAGGQVAMAMTNRLRNTDLPSDEILQAGPMIFQKEVKKKHEVRVTCMGGFPHATKLNSQSNLSSNLDWRAVNPSELAMEETILPSKVADQCLEILERLDLRFGCIDLIVDPSGDYIFLEVNQMGQFLWIEQFVPSIPMLDHFCSFLLSDDGQYDGVPRMEAGGYPVLMDEIQFILDQDLDLYRKAGIEFNNPSELTHNRIVE